jgi:hypothetical protein
MWQKADAEEGASLPYSTRRSESMKRLRLLILVAIAGSILAGVAASCALASGPTLLFLGSEKTILLVSLPLDGSGTGKNTTATELQAENTNVRGKGLLLELTLLQTKEGVKGTYLALYLEIEETSGRHKCNTKGDKEGEVLQPQNEAELVYWKTGAELQAGVLFELKEFTVECNQGATTVKIRGSELASINKTGSEERTSAFGAIRCSSTFGIPEKAKYTNFKGEEKEARLETIVATKARAACFLVGPKEETPTFELELTPETTSPAQMAQLDF